MKRAIVLSSLVLSSAMIIVQPASAALFSRDYRTAGDGLLTYDDQTGLEWLDLTETYQLSYAYVVSQLGPGGQWEGFSVATADEVRDMFVSGGWTGGAFPTSNYDKTHLNQALAIVALLGDTHPSPDRAASYGLVSDVNPSNGNQYYSILFTEISSMFSNASHRYFSWPSNSIFIQGGVFLHRLAVPEPASAQIVATGLGILAIILKRSRYRLHRNRKNGCGPH